MKIATQLDKFGQVALIWVDPATDELRMANPWEGSEMAEYDAEDFGTTLSALRAELTEEGGE